LFNAIAGVSWAVDIAKDDPSLVAYGNVGYTPVYISSNSGTNFIATPNQYAEQILYYDRSNLFINQHGAIYKMNVSYQMPVIGITQISTNIPNDFMLWQNYPNPFNPVTNIKFDVPYSSAVKLTVYDVTGRVIDELVNDVLNAGTYNADWNANNVSSGIYFYRIETIDFSETKKMVLIK
jgi:hypothetical protein